MCGATAVTSAVIVVTRIIQIPVRSVDLAAAVLPAAAGHSAAHAAVAAASAVAVVAAAEAAVADPVLVAEDNIKGKKV